jgi:molybdopterin synthase sulfur carrier subunit
MITIKYFAGVREALGREGDLLEADTVHTVGDVWNRVSDRPNLPARLLIAVNQEYAEMDQLIQDGDEVAFFPTVTGG